VVRIDEFLITGVASIYEFSRTGSTEKFSNTPAYQNVNICESPVSTELQMSYVGPEGYQLFNIIIYDTTVTIKNGDKIVNQDGTTYYVKGRPMIMNTPFLSFIKVLTEQIF
jgi:hypothetical protein